MRDARQILVAIVVVLVATTLGGAANAGTTPIWPGYHYDVHHTGQNPNSTDIKGADPTIAPDTYHGPSSINLIWTFPRLEYGAGITDENLPCVDNTDPGFTSSGDWTALDGTNWKYEGIADIGYVGSNFLSVPATESEKGEISTARWAFPSGLPAGKYRIYVSIPFHQEQTDPSRNTNATTAAEYTVTDALGVHTAKLDQSQHTTQWRILPGTYWFSGTGANEGVELSSLVTDEKEAGKMVIADAVRFFRIGAIYASPASADIDSADLPQVAGISKWPSTTTCVFVGTVEPVRYSYTPGDPTRFDQGALYGVYSVTPITKKLSEVTDQADQDAYEKIATYLGKPMWRYPRSGTDPSKPDWVGNRDPIEGPIWGGFYSSPVVANVVIQGGNPQPVVFASAMDRQMYAIDARRGDLLWKGPGITVSENVGGDLNGWSQTAPRADAFGGTFRYTTCVGLTDNNPATATWYFTDADHANAAWSASGLSYSVYAWMPEHETGEPLRSRAATYKVYCGTSGNPTATVTIDQGDPSMCGTWVKIGGSYFKPTKVTLSNTATPEEGKTASDYVVVADAVMIVPDGIDGLGYSSPVTDAEGPFASTNAQNVFVMSENGRVMSFFAAPMDNHIGHLNWVFPSIRTSATGRDEPDWGDTGASLAYSNDSVYAATLEGYVRCISGARSGAPTLKWQFHDADNEDGSLGGFTSSPTLDTDHNQLFIGSTYGVFYCLNMSDGSVVWQYPRKSASQDTPYEDPPLGGFRYSTPVVASVQDGHVGPGGIRRVWCASSDGKIYSFLADTGERLYTEENGAPHNPSAPYYSEPSLLAPVQGSVAMDGAGSGAQNPNPIMYVGDMNGTLHWRDAVTGSKQSWQYSGWNASGALFSSPNITNTTVSGTAGSVSWIYVGSDDGYLLAFSHGGYGGAWGGEWQGGEWPFGEQGQQESRVQAAPETEMQFEMFTSDFYMRTHNFNPEPIANGAPDASKIDAWPDDVIVSKEMKVYDAAKDPDHNVDAYLSKQARYRRQAAFMPPGRDATNATMFFEWGESIYLILWNLPESKFISGGNGGITIRMTNASSGSGSGSRISYSGSVQHIRDYTVVEPDGSGGYKNLTDADGNPVRRSYALARIDFDGTRTSDPLPPPPGPGWVITVEVRKLTAVGGNMTRISWPLAQLTGPTGSPSHYELKKFTPQGSTVEELREATIGINNPLAIRDDGFSNGRYLPATGIGWDDSTNRKNQPDVHMNGNAIWTTSSTSAGGYNIGYAPRPLIDLYYVPHGASSREGFLVVADRSHTAITTTGASSGKTLQRFRIDNNDLRFRGFPYSVEAYPMAYLPDNASSTNTDYHWDVFRQFGLKYGIVFPWEKGAGSEDYPNIYRKYQTFQHVSSDKDPTSSHCTLWGVARNPNYSGSGDAYLHSVLTPDTVLVSVDVPRFQPANVWDDPTQADRNRKSEGYSRTMTAYIDSNGNGTCDTGNTVRGAPTTWQEAYRQFRVQVKVPPDPKIEVDEQVVDVGSAPHGLGEPPLGPLAFSAYNPDPAIQQWFKQITIKNAGNVNLYNIRINQALGLFGDEASPSAVLPGLAITSSLDDPAAVPVPFPQFAAEPFVTTLSTGGGLGFTLSKPRVGDPDPTIMTIPDKRKWDEYPGTAAAAQPILSAAGFNPDSPLPVKVSVRVPLTQPIGTYQSWDPVNRIPYVTVFSDQDNNGVPTLYSYEYSNGYKVQLGEPVAMPSFQLKVAVRENQLTGGSTPTTLAQIDHITTGPTTPDAVPKVGDATPAAFRDAEGKVNLFWSSNLSWALNRNFTSTTFPLPLDKLASAPWFLNYAVLGYGNANWLNADQFHWWNVPGSQIPQNAWPTGYIPSGHSLLRWPDASGTAYSVKHFSPSVGENAAVARTADKNRTWLVWASSADLKENATNKITQAHLISYLDVTTGPSVNAMAINHDQSQVKRSPCAVPDGNRMWIFWQGGNDGTWSIDYTYSNAGPNFPPDSWLPDQKLRTPDCMASVGSPNALLRHWWADLRGASDDWEDDFTDAYRDTLSNATKAFDVVYAGVNKITRNSDIILSRYVAMPPNGDYRVQPSRTAQPLPRVFDEVLVRDPKFGFYTSRHLVWMRSPAGGPFGPDSWGGYDINSPTKNLPYVRVYFPDGYDYSTPKLAPGSWISATDASSSNGGSPVDPPVTITPDIDDATGIYTYNYPDGTLAKQILGRMLVDFSSGIVRFTEPLKEKRLADGKTVTPEVHADYTPQAWRITTDAAADGSPHAFIEHTSMTDPALGVVVNGLDPTWPTDKPAPVDRLWVFWRKAGTAVDSSTIFYTTMRIGVDLAKLGLPPIPVDPISGKVKPTTNLTVSGALGPFEIDRTGTKIYFSEVDERYASLITPDNAAVLGMPGQLTISYRPESGPDVRNVPLRDISWITELPEQSLFGFAADSNVNEGSIYAFADPNPKESGTSTRVLSSKIWVFWTSTRGGNSDLYWETLSPNFWAR